MRLEEPGPLTQESSSTSGRRVEDASTSPGRSGRVESGARPLERLLWKYRLLTRLRSRREAVEAGGAASFEAAESRERKRLFRRVAREFPGALRELDTLESAQLAARAERVEEAIDRLERGGEAPQPGQWLALVLDFHQTLRDALMLKRWLARRLPPGGGITGEVVEEFDRGLARLRRIRGLRVHRPQLAAHEQAALLRDHLRPPGGRLLSLIWGELEARHGRSRVELEQMLFGAAR